MIDESRLSGREREEGRMANKQGATRRCLNTLKYRRVILAGYYITKTV